MDKGAGSGGELDEQRARRSLRILNSTFHLGALEEYVAKRNTATLQI